MGKLRASDLDTLPHGKHHDGEGLYYDRKKRGGAWIYKFTLNGHAREMGLGSYPAISITTARTLAAKARSQKAQGIDPVDARRARLRQGVTFEAAAREYWQAHRQNDAKPNNWLGGMQANVFPHIGNRGVADLTPDELAKFLKPIWHREKTRKLRQWINAVVKYVSLDDPRVDRDLMEKVGNRLGPQNIEAENHPAVAWQQIPNLWMALPADTLVGASLRLLMLTGLRVACVVKAEWSEIDLKKKVWTVPKGRVKEWKYSYRVPLTPEMLTTLDTAKRKWGSTGLLFPSPGSGSGMLSNNAHRLWLHEHGWRAPDERLASAHGLRSAIRTWMHDRKPPVEWRLGEHILQHMSALGATHERAYLQSDQLDQRREVMEEWSRYCISAQHHADKMNVVAESSTGRTVGDVAKWYREEQVAEAEMDRLEDIEGMRRTRDEDDPD